MKGPTILYENMISTASTFSATSTATGYDIDNLLDWRTHTFWKANSTVPANFYVTFSAGVAPNAMGIAGHNLNGRSWTLVAAPATDETSYVIVSTGVIGTTGAYLTTYTPATNYTKWNLAISSGVAPQIAILCIGRAMEFPTPPAYGFIPYQHKTEVQTNRSNGGVMLGANIKYHSFEINASFPYLPTTFFWDSTGGNATWMNFYANHGRMMKPFFWGFSLDTYPNMNALVKLTDDYSPPLSMYGLTYIQGFSMSMEGQP